ncbi:hypothetical protein AVEN_2061-1 [Araneus ventricosus]|uniref:Uncharacterized protein n=1 Tax=Araneus ventricosus TaxID=182803 RepID=A0A4Y2MG99_ARAVE|nr:hypothetical protein AVEN_2061-1 [Araneus ventricosus]
MAILKIGFLDEKPGVGVANCEKLNLIARVNEMKARFDPKLEFPKLFTGIGKIEKSLPATDKRLSEIWQAQQQDEVCIQLINFAQKGWPEKNALPTHLSR